MPKFSHDELLKFGAELLLAAGLPRDDSRLVAKLLLKGELDGYPGHGISRIPSYVSRIKQGVIRLDRPKVIREGKSTAVIDGNFAIGQIVAQEGMNLAIEKAREHGVGIVCLRRAGHVGRLADYVELAAKAGMAGMAAVSVGSGNIASYGGMEPVSGTNPMAYGFPAKNGQHFILDFATAAMSMGELQKKVSKGEVLPGGVMLDGYGNPINDFKAFIGPPKGVVLPFGGYKGSGLHLVAEILGGILSGSGLSREWWTIGGGAINGVLLQALCVEEFQPLDSFLDQMEDFVAFAKSRKPAPGFEEILLPGEGSRRRAEKQLKEGIQLEKAAWAGLCQCAAELGVEVSSKPLNE